MRLIAEAEVADVAATVELEVALAIEVTAPTPPSTASHAHIDQVSDQI